MSRPAPGSSPYFDCQMSSIEVRDLSWPMRKNPAFTAVPSAFFMPLTCSRIQGVDSGQGPSSNVIMNSLPLTSAEVVPVAAGALWSGTAGATAAGSGVVAGRAPATVSPASCRQPPGTPAALSKATHATIRATLICRSFASANQVREDSGGYCVTPAPRRQWRRIRIFHPHTIPAAGRGAECTRYGGG